MSLPEASDAPDLRTDCRAASSRSRLLRQQWVHGSWAPGWMPTTALGLLDATCWPAEVATGEAAATAALGDGTAAAGARRAATAGFWRRSRARLSAQRPWLLARSAPPPLASCKRPEWLRRPATRADGYQASQQVRRAIRANQNSLLAFPQVRNRGADMSTRRSMRRGFLS